jgi:hypothetical protein
MPSAKRFYNIAQTPIPMGNRYQRDQLQAELREITHKPVNLGKLLKHHICG